MFGRYIQKDEYGNCGGISAYWRWYTELPSGIKLVEAGKRPQRDANGESTWTPSPLQYGGVVTKTWNLTKNELVESIQVAFEKSLVYVGRGNIDTAITELAQLGFTVKADEWADKGYITKA